VAVDLPGQFESPGPEDEGAYLPAPLGKLVAGLVERLAEDGKPVVLLGHSFGGLVARAAVLTGAPVAGLTLLDSGPGALPEGQRREALRLGEPLLREKGLAAAYAMREEINARFPAWATLPVELKDFYRRRFISSSRAGLLGMAEGLRCEPDLVDSLAAELRGRALPSLVVSGESDDAWSMPAQREMATRLGAPFHAVTGAGHSPNTENPAGLLKVLLSEWRAWLHG
jgi:pimeloyl-ACP methyl ester carboxylesterase